ncbi:hypothetical protein [Thermococcus sp. 21S7]|uniref:hypothetical protein n=1 Tax=Thermococcus sp. 21S7 TaxID=1638221 RepID=UPI0014386EA1|nr:hypothetical protein [Thermococcus sp. 21S7]NJE62521.1 hypothetical protein [Thermococcus sp. 21S7]
MSKGLLIMATITIALVAYALTTAQIPPASIEYKEVFYTNNQSVTYITKDGFGLFSMDINPKVNSFELSIEFPEGTSYMVRYGDQVYRGKDEFKITVEKGSLPDEVYVHFQLPKELTRKLIYENGEAVITIRGDKTPIWHAEDTIIVRYKKKE